MAAPINEHKHSAFNKFQNESKYNSMLSFLFLSFLIFFSFFPRMFPLFYLKFLLLICFSYFKSIQEEAPWCMLFKNDLLLVDERKSEVELTSS